MSNSEQERKEELEKERKKIKNDFILIIQASLIGTLIMLIYGVFNYIWLVFK